MLTEKKKMKRWGVKLCLWKSHISVISCGISNCGMLNFTKFVWDIIFIYAPFIFVFADINSSLQQPSSVQKDGVFYRIEEQEEKV